MENKIRKVFEVLIHNKPYDVYDIEGKENHNDNRIDKTRWIYYADREPLMGLTPPIDSEYWVPWHDWINRRLWEIKFRQTNTSKVKWDDYHFSSTTWVEMWCNGRLVYEFGTTGNDSGLAFAFGKVQYMKVLMSEHCYNFFEPEKENGRKIYWMGLPATIRVKHNTWEVAIVPDYSTGISKEEWWKELERRESKIGDVISKEDADMDKMYKNESREQGEINWGDAFEDKHIDWFRK